MPDICLLDPRRLVSARAMVVLEAHVDTRVPADTFLHRGESGSVSVASGAAGGMPAAQEACVAAVEG